MAGPGGGGFGGGGGRGFGGGGFGGGGFGGGGRGFGGPHFHHHGPHFHGGWFFRPRYHYYGGGCLGGLLGMMLMPVIFILVAISLLVSSLGSAFGSITTGGPIMYDENAIQDYANVQYMTEFGAQTDSEDALMIVFLVEDENYYEYAYIAWCGDHLNGKINEMFGSNGSAFGNAILGSAINSNSYKYSLDSGIAQVMGVMQARVEALGLESSLTCGHEAGEYRSHLINHTALDMTADTVNAALESFTASTGIPVAVVVEDAEEVLPRNFDYFSVLVALIFLGVGVFMIVRMVKERDEAKKNKNGKENDDNYNRYA